MKKVKTHPNKYTIKDMIYPNTISGSALAAHTALSACLDQDLIFRFDFHKPRLFGRIKGKFILGCLFLNHRTKNA
ncbi:MAG: hypothetical protein P8Y68_20595 [Anaerolineales bacterium]